jgi:hypothetical protein
VAETSALFVFPGTSRDELNASGERTTWTRDAFWSQWARQRELGYMLTLGMPDIAHRSELTANQADAMDQALEQLTPIRERRRLRADRDSDSVGSEIALAKRNAAISTAIRKFDSELFDEWNTDGDSLVEELTAHRNEECGPFTDKRHNAMSR